MFHHQQMGPPGYEAQYPVAPGGRPFERPLQQQYDGYNSEPPRQIARNSQNQQQQPYDPAFPLDSVGPGPVPPPYNHPQSHQLRPPGPSPMQAPSSYYGSSGLAQYAGMPQPGRYSDEMFSSGVDTPRPMRFNPGGVAPSMEMPYYGGRPADPRSSLDYNSSNITRPWDHQSDPYGRLSQPVGGEASRGQVPAVNPPPPPPPGPAPISSQVDQFLAAYRKSTEQRYLMEATPAKAEDNRQYMQQGVHEQRNPEAEAFSRPNRPPETKTFQEETVFKRRRDLDDSMESGINPPPPETGGRNADPNVSTFQRTVTHVEGEIGFAGTDLFFQMSKIIGSVRPQKGDSVVVKAERVHSMPFDWNALSVQVLSAGTEEKSSRGNKDDEDSFEQMPLMLPSTQQSKPLKSILKNKPPPPPPVISQQPSKGKLDYHHKKQRTPSPDAPRYEEKVSRRSPSPKRRKFSPDRRLDLESFLMDLRSRSPGARGNSPGRRSRSPGTRPRSPGRRSRSPPPPKRSHSPVIIRKLSPPRGFSPPNKLPEKSRDLSPVVRRIPPAPRETSPLSPIVVFRRRTPSPNAYFCISPTSGLRRKPPSPYLPKRTTSPGTQVRKGASPGPEMRRKSPSPKRRLSSTSSSSDSGRRKKSKSKKKSKRSPSPLRRKRSRSRSRNRSTSRSRNRSTSRSRSSTSRSRRSTSRTRRSTSRSRRSTSRTRYRSLSPLQPRRGRSRSLSPLQPRRGRSRSASPDSIEITSSFKGQKKAPLSKNPLKQKGQEVKKARQDVTIVRVPQKIPPVAPPPKEKPRPMSLAFNWAKSAKEPPMLTGGLVKKAPAKRPKQQLPAFKVVETKKTDAEILEEIKKKIQVEKLKLAGEKIQEEKKRLKAAVASKALEKKGGQDPPPVAPIAPSFNPSPAINQNIYPNPHYHSSNLMGQQQPYYQSNYQVPYSNFGPQAFPMYNEPYGMGGRMMMPGPMFPGPMIPPAQPRPEIPPARLFRSTMDSIRGIRTTLKGVSYTSSPPVVYAKKTPQEPAKVSAQVPTKVSPQVPPKVSPTKLTSKPAEKVAPATKEKPSSEKLKPPGEDDDDITVISIKTREKIVEIDEQAQVVKSVTIKPEVEVVQLESLSVKEPEPDEIDDEIDPMDPSMAFELGCHADKTSKARNWMICVRCAQRGHLISMCDKQRIPRALPFEISQAREMLVDSKREHLEQVAKLKGTLPQSNKTDFLSKSKGDSIDNNKSSEVSKSADDGKGMTQQDKSKVTQQDKSKVTQQDKPKVTQQDKPKVTQQDKPKVTQQDTKTPKVLSSKLTKSTREKFEQEMMEGPPPPARRPIRARNLSFNEEERDSAVESLSGPVKPVFRISRRRSASPNNNFIEDPMKAVAVKQLELDELSLRDMEIGKKMQILRMQKDRIKFSGWSGEEERPDPFCYICFKRGHKAKNCNAPCPSWIRLRVRVREGMLVERAPGQMEPFCLACGKCGHFTRTCYQRQAYEVYSDDD